MEEKLLIQNLGLRIVILLQNEKLTQSQAIEALEYARAVMEFDADSIELSERKLTIEHMPKYTF